MSQSNNNFFDKTTFLFGAGAEQCYGLPAGSEFTYECLIKEDKELADIIKTNFNKYLKDTEYKNWLGKNISAKSSTKIIFANIVKRTIICLIEKDIKPVPIDDKKFVNFISAYLNKDIIAQYNNDEEIDQSLLNNNIKEYRNDLYEAYCSYFENKNNDQISEYRFKGLFEDWYEHLINYGSVEKYFDTIINPNKYGPDKFIKLVNYYWKAYFSIISKLVDYKSYEDFFNNIEGIYQNNNFIDYNKYIRKNSNIENYYTYMKNLDNKKDLNFITTNYTELAQNVIGIDNKKIAYVNGKLNWFEFPYEMEVVDIKEAYKKNNLFKTGHIFFPFIFATSSFKPIVHPKQTEEYNKAKKLLDESTNLVSIGYSFSEDDNHLIALIKYWLKNNNTRRLIITHYYSDGEKVLTEEKIRNKYLEKFHVDDTELAQQIFVVLNCPTNGKSLDKKLFNKLKEFYN